MALTTADKKWLGKNFVSKTDLKKELKKFATKKDLENFATKKDLENFATKSDLAASNVRLGLEIDRTKRELKDEINSKHDEVMTSLDAIMKEVVAGREHDLVVVYQQDEQNKRLDKLEKVVGISTQL